MEHCLMSFCSVFCSLSLSCCFMCAILNLIKQLICSLSETPAPLEVSDWGYMVALPCLMLIGVVFMICHVAPNVI